MNIKEIPSLSLSEAFNKFTINIFKLKGRSRRSEYWWPMAVLFFTINILIPYFRYHSVPTIPLLLLEFFLYITTIPLTFRRLHDTGRSGWWWGIGCILQVVFFLSLIHNLFIAGLNVYDSITRNFNIYNLIENIYNLIEYEEFISTFFTIYTVWFGFIVAYKIVLLILMCFDSDIEDNEYGESPKYVDDDSDCNDDVDEQQN